MHIPPWLPVGASVFTSREGQVIQLRQKARLRSFHDPWPKQSIYIIVADHIRRNAP